MNEFEIAQKLKDAGYPVDMVADFELKEKYMGVALPPLTQQLTGWLGKQLNYVQRTENGTFTAYTHGTTVPSQTGATIDEALAFLLLALKV